MLLKSYLRFPTFMRRRSVAHFMILFYSVNIQRPFVSLPTRINLPWISKVSIVFRTYLSLMPNCLDNFD